MVYAVGFLVVLLQPCLLDILFRAPVKYAADLPLKLGVLVNLVVNVQDSEGGKALGAELALKGIYGAFMLGKLAGVNRFITSRK